MIDKNTKSPATVDQVENKKPAVPTTFTILSGNIGNSMNGGHDKTIHWKQCMAGEKFKEYRIQLNMQMLTPISPAYQKLRCTVRSFYVPNSRIWTNAEKFTAQKGGSTVDKITTIPNLGGQDIPTLPRYESSSTPAAIKSIMHTTAWRNLFISNYIPRFGPNQENTELTSDKFITKMPAISALPLRGYKAIYNDYLRNKEYEEEVTEYKGDEVTREEWLSYYRKTAGNNYTYLYGRTKRENSYYTDIRTEMQGFEEESPISDLEDQVINLVTWSSFVNKIAESRSQAENAQANDWDIIAKLRGSKKLTQGKVQLIGQKTFDLNYSAITQTSYNNAEGIRPEYQVMGKQGAYSYTNIDIPVFAGYETQEEGYIHVIATVTCESVFESAIDRLEMNINWDDQYRPDLEKDKLDVMYEAENGYMSVIQNPNSAIGFKRRFNEYFKLANVIAGDATNRYYSEIKSNTSNIEEYTDERVITQNTYQFYETSRFEEGPSEGGYIADFGTNKKIWLDYTDFLINKNQAIENEITQIMLDDYLIKGNNQIFFFGKAYALVSLPISQDIQDNYTTWGEE